MVRHPHSTLSVAGQGNQGVFDLGTRLPAIRINSRARTAPTGTVSFALRPPFAGTSAGPGHPVRWTGWSGANRGPDRPLRHGGAAGAGREAIRSRMSIYCRRPRAAKPRIEP